MTDYDDAVARLVRAGLDEATAATVADELTGRPPTQPTHRSQNRPMTQSRYDPDALRRDRTALVAEWGTPDPDDRDLDREARSAGALIRMIDRELDKADAHAERQQQLDQETDPRKLAQALPRY